MIKRYIIYLMRWQLSTPILAICVAWFQPFGNVTATIIANLTGGLIFFWIDRIIFLKKRNWAVWSIEPQSVCVDCGRAGRGYRLVESGRYDRSGDARPQYRCEPCSIQKAFELKARGVSVS